MFDKPNVNLNTYTRNKRNSRSCDGFNIDHYNNETLSYRQLYAAEKNAKLTSLATTSTEWQSESLSSTSPDRGNINDGKLSTKAKSTPATGKKEKSSPPKNKSSPNSSSSPPKQKNGKSTLIIPKDKKVKGPSSPPGKRHGKNTSSSSSPSNQKHSLTPPQEEETEEQILPSLSIATLKEEKKGIKTPPKEKIRKSFEGKSTTSRNPSKSISSITLSLLLNQNNKIDETITSDNKDNDYADEDYYDYDYYNENQSNLKTNEFQLKPKTNLKSYKSTSRIDRICDIDDNDEENARKKETLTPNDDLMEIMRFQCNNDFDEKSAYEFNVENSNFPHDDDDAVVVENENIEKINFKNKKFNKQVDEGKTNCFTDGEFIFGPYDVFSYEYQIFNDLSSTSNSKNDDGNDIKRKNINKHQNVVAAVDVDAGDDYDVAGDGGVGAAAVAGYDAKSKRHDKFNFPKKIINPECKLKPARSKTNTTTSTTGVPTARNLDQVQTEDLIHFDDSEMDSQTDDIRDIFNSLNIDLEQPSNSSCEHRRRGKWLENIPIIDDIIEDLLLFGKQLQTDEDEAQIIEISNEDFTSLDELFAAGKHKMLGGGDESKNSSKTILDNYLNAKKNQENVFQQAGVRPPKLTQNNKGCHHQPTPPPLPSLISPINNNDNYLNETAEKNSLNDYVRFQHNFPHICGNDYNDHNNDDDYEDDAVKVKNKSLNNMPKYYKNVNKITPMCGVAETGGREVRVGGRGAAAAEKDDENVNVVDNGDTNNAHVLNENSIKKNENSTKRMGNISQKANERDFRKITTTNQNAESAAAPRQCEQRGEHSSSGGSGNDKSRLYDNCNDKYASPSPTPFLYTNPLYRGSGCDDEYLAPVDDVDADHHIIRKFPPTQVHSVEKFPSRFPSTEKRTTLSSVSSSPILFTKTAKRRISDDEISIQHCSEGTAVPVLPIVQPHPPILLFIGILVWTFGNMWKILCILSLPSTCFGCLVCAIV